MFVQYNSEGEGCTFDLFTITSINNDLCIKIFHGRCSAVLYTCGLNIYRDQARFDINFEVLCKYVNMS